MLFLGGQLFLALLLIEPLAVIHYPAYRRTASRRNLDKVKPRLPCHRKPILCINYPHLIVFFINKPNRAYADLFIDPSTFVC